MANETELYEIEAYFYEAGRDRDFGFEDIRYDMTRVECDGTWNDFAEAYQDDEDLRLVCREEFADQFITAHFANYEDKSEKEGDVMFGGGRQSEG